MRLLLNRFRLVLPTEGVLVGFAVAYAVVAGITLWVEGQVGQPVGNAWPPGYLVRIAAFCYGWFRVQGFHPVYQAEYRVWLERSPWTSRKALPAGPVALTWADALPIGGLAALAAIQGHPEPTRVVIIALMGYFLPMIRALLTTAPIAYGFLVAFGFGLIVRTWYFPEASLASASATYLVCWVGLRVGLARFPWPGFEHGKPANMAEAAKEAQEKSCGFPFDQLQPKLGTEEKAPRYVMVLVSLLIGWYAFAAWAVLPNPAMVFMLFFWNVILYLALGRTAIYVAGYAPPISLIGRIRTMRLIIPGYDQIFVAPICTLLVGVLAVDRFRPKVVSEEYLYPIALALAFLVALTTGPTLTRWRLTGRHRITSVVSNKNGIYVKVG